MIVANRMVGETEQKLRHLFLDLTGVQPD